MPLKEQLALSRDRITELLTKKKPELGDIASAFLRSSTGRTTYGEEMNRMKAGRLAEQKTLFDVLSGHKKMKQAGRRLDLTENQFDFNKMKFKTGQEVAVKKNFEERFEFWAKDLKKQDQVRLYEFARDQYPDADKNADAALAAGMRELGLKKPQPEGGDFTLSPGAKRYDAKGNLIAEAPTKPEKPTNPVRITLSPGQIVVDENGNEVARGREKGTKTFTLSPGQVVMDGEGNVLARGAEKAQPGFSLAPGGQRFDAQGNPIASVPEPERPSIERIEAEAEAKRPPIERIRAEAKAKLLAKVDVLNQLLQASGAEPLPEAEGQAEGPAISTPFGPQEAASEDAQEVASLFLAARRLLLVGETGMANNLLAQARFITENSTDIQRQQELDKSISSSLASELGVPVGTTIREVLGQLPPSPGELAEEKAIGSARGRGTVEGEEQLAFIDDATIMINNFLEELEVDPGIAGIRGSLRATGQTAFGVLGDLGFDALVDTARDLAFDSLSLDEAEGMFDSPTLSVLGILENSIGLVLARLRTPTGRIPVDVIKRSIADVQLTGFKQSKQIVNRLKFILSQFDRRGKSIRKRFGLSDTPRLKVEGGVLVPMEQ